MDNIGQQGVGPVRLARVTQHARPLDVRCAFDRLTSRRAEFASAFQPSPCWAREARRRAVVERPGFDGGRALPASTSTIGGPYRGIRCA